MKKRGVKRLTRLKVSEISAVDNGAGGDHRLQSRPAVVLMKRAGRRFDFNGAASLVRVDKAGKADRIAAALAEIEENRAVAKAAAPFVGDFKMQTVDVMKADAVAIIKKFDDKVDEIAKRHKITRGAALLKVAQDREMAADWFAYRQAQQIVGAQFTPTPEPERTALSPAFVKMQEKAEKRARKNGTSVATEFSKIYADPENADLVQADKAFHVSKASGGGLPDPMEELVRTVQMVLGCSIEHARGLALEIRAKKPSGDALYPRPAA